jgi:putative ABC transport system substrate-binding protein
MLPRILKGRQAWRIAGHAADEIRVVINLKTAKALGIAVPQSVQSRADEMIE